MYRSNAGIIDELPTFLGFFSHLTALKTAYLLGFSSGLIKVSFYSNNFRKMVPGTAVNAKKAASYCEYLYETVKEFAEMPKENALEVLEVARRFQAMRGS